MKKILLVFLLMICTNTFAQKLYVWPPKNEIPSPRPLFQKNDTINLSIFDGRTLTKKSKIECSSEELINSITNFIKIAYPNAYINAIPPQYYYKEAKENVITIKIGVSAYHAAFGSDIKIGIGNLGGNFSYGIFPEGKWNALTTLHVKIYDYRNNNKTIKETIISKEASKPNIGGYRTAKNILNTTYLNANTDMLFFIDNVFMK